MKKYSVKYKATLSLLLLVVLSIPASSQTIGILAGANANRFRPGKDNSNNSSTPAIGYITGMSIEGIPVAPKRTIGFILKFENYGGSLHTENSSPSSQFTTDVKTSKDVIGIEAYLVNFNSQGGMQLCIGGEGNWMVYNKTTVHEQGFRISSTPYTNGYSSNTDSVETGLSSFNYGLDLRLVYSHINFGSRYLLIPQCKIFFGFSKEIEDSPAIRFSLGIGIAMKR